MIKPVFMLRFIRFASHEKNGHENQDECKAGGDGGLLNYYYRKAARITPTFDRDTVSSMHRRT